MEYIDAINELNYDLYERFGEVDNQFNYSTDGNVDVIKFGGIILWHSEDDDREFDESTDNYEPIIPFIKRKFNNWIDEVQSLRFDDVK